MNSNVGYTGKIIVDKGAISAPYIPVIEKMTWQKYLHDLHLKYLSWTQLSNKEGDGLADANEMMKQQYPGNYHLIETYDSVKGKFVFKLKFSDPHEETIWLLKNS